jgi:phage gp46-like protein
VQNTFFPKYDVTVDWNLLANGTLDDTQALATAIIVALGTNKLADPSDILPDPNSTDRMGWWGDLDAEEIWDGWPIGSRLWLLKRSKITDQSAAQGSTVAWVETYITEAIQPFIQRRIGSRFTVDASRVGIEQIDAVVRVYRGPALEIDLQFQVLWNEIPEQIPHNPYNPPAAGPPR